MSFSARGKLDVGVTVWDRRGILRGKRRDLLERVEVEAKSLDQALVAAERIFSVSIRPAVAHDRYFLVECASSSAAEARPSRDLLATLLARVFPSRRPAGCPPELGNTDIHVLREGAELCPKQDLAFPLQGGDVVVFEVLLC